MNSELTLGAVHDRLAANGYTAVSIFSTVAKHAYRLADDPAAVLCLPDNRERRVVSLIVTTRDKAVRALVAGVFEKHGLARGPVRIDSAGNEHRPLRFDDYEPPLNRSWTPSGAPAGQDPAVILEWGDSLGLGQGIVSAIIRLEGTWRGGDLLTTPRAKLPAIDRDGIEKLFIELRVLVTTPEPWIQPAFQPAPAERDPNRPRLAAIRSKRDLSGQPALLVAHMQEVARGECEELPDRPPEETVAAVPATAPRSLLSSLFGS